ncbi:aldehyde dehydrogenase family protein [Luteipulveratus mongoliensis]|uniref:Aldehyde dehydrogenase n=1 Tax=Luteipulveratus mongoliensis TaxID=571913 RepID=A0A0K1JF96_9MICO|nr:aldehyde dehydrogenase family protein [Luteipulveratus mongoliensis]AKU15248.1 succinate-semialdehyde dehydrogenase [Luteipulveratus mongoliensis]
MTLIEEAVVTAGPISVENPSTGETIRQVPSLSEGEVDSLVYRARAAQPAWEALGFAGRRRYFKRMQKWLLEHREQIARQIHAENGKSMEEATIEVAYGVLAASFWARKAEAYLKDEHPHTSSPFAIGRRLTIRYAPLGVIGVIGPWNNPLLNNFGDVIPALAAGNAVILKPSEITPLVSLLMAEMVEEIGLPKDVFIVATGAGETGAALVERVDGLMFTGSTRTGKKVAARCGERLIPCSLELGGKDPLIVLADADLDRAANLAVFSAMHNTGQTCTSTERVYVEAPVYDEFVAKVTETFKALRVGESTEFGTSDSGALTFPPQLDIVQRHVKDALDKGAKALTGGRIRTGRFFEPTVLVDVEQDMACMREETFGPTMPIMKVESAEEAIRLANDTSYGLQASIFSRDGKRAEQLARQIEAGTVTINDSLANYFALELPMGGWKDSGLGSRHGREGIRKFTRRQSLMRTRMPMKKELHGMPFEPKNFGLIVKMVETLYGRPRGTR